MAKKAPAPAPAAAAAAPPAPVGKRVTFIDIESAQKGKKFDYPALAELATRLDEMRSDPGFTTLSDTVDNASGSSTWTVHASNARDADEKLLAGVYGLLAADARISSTGFGGLAKDDRLTGWITSALGEYNRLRKSGMADAVLQAIEANPGNDAKAVEWMTVTRDLSSSGLAAKDHILGIRVNQSLAQLSGAVQSIEASASRELAIPNIEKDTDLELQADNIKATQAIYFCAMLDEMRLFDVVDKLIEHFQNGLLPLGRGQGGQLLYKYWRNSSQRLTSLERRGLYARCFGMLSGIPGEPANTQFDSLSLRFISGVSEYYRQNQISNLIAAKPGAVVFGVSQEAVRKSARDLASNLSLIGFGITFFAGSELMSQVNDALAILKDPDIRSAYGARDQWQVVEQVNALDFATPRNTYRFRTTAHAGAVFIRWLANNTPKLTGSLTSIISDADIKNRVSAGDRVLEVPTDYDLVNACEQWLAVNGVPDTKVEEYSQPIESPLISSRPINLPDISQTVNDALAGAGVPMSMNARNGRMNGSNGRARSNGAAGAFARY